jgi:hypothetical protein
LGQALITDLAERSITITIRGEWLNKQNAFAMYSILQSRNQATCAELVSDAAMSKT